MELSQGALIGILVAVLVADMLVVVIALAWTQIRRRRHITTPTGNAPAMGAGSPAMGPRPGPVAMSAYPAASSTSTANSVGRGMTPMVPTAVVPPPAESNADALTGLLTNAAWSRIVVDEEARIRRYRRPATIVMVELQGLDRLIEFMGPASVDRIVPAVADQLRRDARESDHVARLGIGRFAVLLPETDEILAINYVERVRRACDLWLESGSVALRMAMGWASSAADGSLSDAEGLATDRMFIELRRAERNAGPTDPPPGAARASGGNGGMAPAYNN
jgi:diguanylate cyclase (GGDEF)-like protein